MREEEVDEVQVRFAYRHTWCRNVNDMWKEKKAMNG